MHGKNNSEKHGHWYGGNIYSPLNINVTAMKVQNSFLQRIDFYDKNEKLNMTIGFIYFSPFKMDLRLSNLWSYIF